MSSFSRIHIRISLLLAMLFVLAVPAITGAHRGLALDNPPPLVFSGEIHGRARVNVGSLNLRTGPHVSYTAVAYLMQGEEVAIVGRNRESTWVQIRLYNGYRGWINAAYILTNVPVNTLPIIDISLLGITAFITNDPVAIFDGPGTGYRLIGRARPGDVLALNGRDADAEWVHVYLPDGRTGWAASASSFLPSGSINDLPIIVPFLDAQPANLAPFFLAYAGPGFLYPSIDNVKEGQALTIVARTADNRWLQVRLPDGQEGWIAADVVHLNAAPANVPVVTGIAPPAVVGWRPSQPAQLPPAKIPLKPTPVPTATETPEPPATPTSESTATPEPTATATQPATPTATTTGTPPPTATTGATPTATSEAPPEATGEETAPTDIPGIYVYDAPDGNATPIMRLLPGRSIVLLGRTADSTWLKIWLADNREGWVRADELQLTIDVDTLPIIEP